MFALEPGQIGKLVLKCHEGNQSPPCCVVLAKSVRQQMEFDRAYEDVWKANDGDKSEHVTQRIIDLFKLHVERIEGYQSESVEDAFTHGGMVEILQQLVGGRLLQYEQKKS